MGAGREGASGSIAKMGAEGAGEAGRGGGRPDGREGERTCPRSGGNACAASPSSRTPCAGAPPSLGTTCSGSHGGEGQVGSRRGLDRREGGVLFIEPGPRPCKRKAQGAPCRTIPRRDGKELGRAAPPSAAPDSTAAPGRSPGGRWRSAPPHPRPAPAQAPPQPRRRCSDASRFISDTHTIATGL